MARMSRETLQQLAREILGLDLSAAEAEEVLAQGAVWRDRLPLLRDLELDGVEPAFLADREVG